MTVLLPDAVAPADNVVVDCVQVNVFEVVGLTVGVPMSVLTEALVVEVQPLLCVTVTT